jgi:multidrug efflux pump subunit AcrA (membrane-fusion protein)
MKRPLVLTLIAVILALISLSAYQVWRMAESRTQREVAKPEQPDAERDHVVLSEEKFTAAGIEVQPAAKHELQSHRIVPGRIDYNATRHVLVKSPFDGLIRRIDVKVGDQVKDGQVMGIVDSPELGERRSDVLLRETDLEQAKNDHDWWHAIQSNLDDLLARLKRPQEMAELEKDFVDKPLGDYRQQILGAYSRMRLDEALAANDKPAV